MSGVGLIWPRSSFWFSVSDIVTGMRFTYDCKHLITVSGDRYPSVQKAPVLLQPCSEGYGGGDFCGLLHPVPRKNQLWRAVGEVRELIPPCWGS